MQDTLLSISLAPLIPLAPKEHGTVEDALASSQKATNEAITKGAGVKLEVPEGDLVVQFASVEKAIACAFEVDRFVEEHNRREVSLNRLVLGLGIHCRSSDPQHALLVVKALRDRAKGTGSVFCSGAARDRTKAGSGYRFEATGELVIEPNSPSILVFTVTEGGLVAGMFELFEFIPRSAPWLIGAALVAAGLYFYPFGIDVETFRLDYEEWEFLKPAPLRSIAILPFSEGGIRRGKQAYGDSIPARVLEDLAGLDELELASREASFAFRGGRDDVASAGSRLDVEGVVTGYTRTTGDWILVHVAVIRVSDQTEVWTGAFYDRVSEMDSIQEGIVEGIARALDLDPPASQGMASRSALPNPAELGQEDYDKLRIDLEAALIQAQSLELGESERVTGLDNLAALYYDSGRDAEAIPLYREVVAHRERELGRDHPQVAVSLNNLASAYVATGRYDQAEPYYVRSLEIRVKTLGPRHPRVATALNNLASLYHRQGRLNDAQKLYERAIEIRMQELEFELGEDAVRLKDLGARYELSGQYNQARRYYHEALVVETGTKGEESLSTTRLYRSLADASAQEGDREASKSFLESALEVVMAKLSPHHAEVGRTNRDLGEIHRLEGRLVEAEKYHERSLEALEYSLGPEHREVAGTLSYLVSIFEIQGRDEEAEAARERAEAIRGIYVGPVFTYVAARDAGQRVARDRVGDELTAPQPLHEYMVTVEVGELADERRRLAESLHSLALLKLEQGSYAQAEAINLRALELRDGLTGRENPLVAMSLHSLARVYTLQRRLSEADQHFEEARLIFEGTLGRIHPHVARCLEDYALMLRAAGRGDEARLAERRAGEIRAALAVPTESV